MATRPSRYYLGSLQDFNMLSLADLLAARDLYHVPLMNKDNVVLRLNSRGRAWEAYYDRLYLCRAAGCLS